MRVNFAVDSKPVLANPGLCKVCLCIGIFYPCGHAVESWMYCEEAERVRDNTPEPCNNREYKFIELLDELCQQAGCYFERLGRRWVCCKCHSKPNREPCCEGRDESGLICSHAVCGECTAHPLPPVPVYDPAIGDWQ
ncbi:hypothetical protein F4779DRAFT_621780 [Xylariaceae sp. FL0662B]|nr:hypothetical protein F4779DRAFT_621780 [Xylariaceae sp. FL0662B]